jgi:hypothetical protein
VGKYCNPGNISSLKCVKRKEIFNAKPEGKGEVLGIEESHY